MKPITPAVYSRPTGDLYLTILELPADGKSVVIRMMYHPFQVWLWIAAAVIALGSLIAMWPDRRRRATSGSEGANHRAAK